MIEALTNERLAELRDGARMAVEQFPSAKDPRVRAMYQGFADACDELLALRASQPIVPQWCPYCNEPHGVQTALSASQRKETL